METKIQEKFKFSLIKTIMVIMQVDILKKMYATKFKVDFSMVISQMKFDVLTDEIKDFIEGTFNEVILKNEDYYNRYCDVVIPNDLKDFDIKARAKVKRRISVSELKAKKESEGLTENERMILCSIQLKQLSTRIHNMGKHGKCTDEEARSIISGIHTMFRKAEPVLEKYGRKGEFKFDE